MMPEGVLFENERRMVKHIRRRVRQDGQYTCDIRQCAQVIWGVRTHKNNEDAIDWLDEHLNDLAIEFIDGWAIFSRE